MVIPPATTVSASMQDDANPNKVFGSQLVSKSSTTPYSDATQVTSTTFDLYYCYNVLCQNCTWL